MFTIRLVSRHEMTHTTAKQNKNCKQSRDCHLMIWSIQVQKICKHCLSVRRSIAASKEDINRCGKKRLKSFKMGDLRPLFAWGSPQPPTQETRPKRKRNENGPDRCTLSLYILPRKIPKARLAILPNLEIGDSLASSKYLELQAVPKEVCEHLNENIRC